MNNRCQLSVGSWNVSGIIHRPSRNVRMCKLEDDNFVHQLKDHDIFCLTETHIGENEAGRLQIKGYHSIPRCRDVTQSNGVYYGGLCLYIRTEIRKGVFVIGEEKETEYIWAKLDRAFFNMDHDVFICFVYARPNGTSGKYGIDVVEKIERDMIVHSQVGKCVLIGDLNAHTKLEYDFIVNDNVNDRECELLSLPTNYMSDKQLPNRCNRDETNVDIQGQAILDLCLSAGLRILNGRKLGDTFGATTYYGIQCNYPTTIDYCLVHEDIFDQFQVFKVDEFTPYSDHCKIHTTLKTGNWKPNNKHTEQGVSLNPLPDKYIWDNLSEQLYVDKLRSMKEKIDDYVKSVNGDTKERVTSASVKLNEIITLAAENIMKKRTFSGRKAKRKRKPKYLDIDCSRAVRDLNKMARKVSKHWLDRELRQQYYKSRKDIRRMIKQKIKVYKDALIDKLNDTTINHAQEYWKLISEIDDIHNTTGKTDNSDNIKPEIWVDHFKALMSKIPPQGKFVDEVNEFIGNENNWAIFNELSFQITGPEIWKATKKLKLGKSCGEDMIVNEMLKSGKDILSPALEKLFNLALCSGKTPASWDGSLLKPLHKGGSVNDPNCFRGISIASCIGKLFFSVLNNRLITFIHDKKLNSEFQIGFEKGSRPADHILTLKTISDKYLCNGKKVYACFVDFQKAFDTVWREGLLYKLIKSGVGGPFGRVIQHMYNNTNVCIKLATGLTEPFMSNTGVKQGCVMSPTLFNIFISDFPDTLKQANCDPVKLHETLISCLLFADDIVLLSESAKGLQNCLNILDEYCKKWLLTVNTKKTKVLIMNKAGILHNDMNFTLNGQILDVVKEYKYLGLLLNNSGSFMKSIDNLSKRAMKAIYKVKNVIYQSGINVNSAIHLFDSLVTPILTYGCEIWGAYIINPKMFDIDTDHSDMYDKQCFDKIDLRYCKNILGVHRKTTNTAVRGELGRYPLAVHIIKLVIKYWMRFAEGNDNPILKACYLENVNMVNKGKPCFLNKVRDIVLNKLRFQEVWNNQGGSKKQSLLKKMCSKLKNIYKSHWNMNVHNNNPHNKLRSYMKFKNTFETEKYLSSMTQTNSRKYFTRLRISAHDLTIERGRYQKPKIPLDLRLCEKCKTLEDEAHFVMSCTANRNYRQARQNCMKELSEIHPSITDMSDNEKFILIMTAEDKITSKIVERFITKMVNLRGHL